MKIITEYVFILNTSCTDLYEKFPNIEFSFEGNSVLFTVPPKDYLK